MLLDLTPTLPQWAYAIILAMGIKTYWVPETQLQGFPFTLSLVPFNPFPHQHNSKLYNLQGQSTKGAHTNSTQGSMKNPSLETTASVFVA